MRNFGYKVRDEAQPKNWNEWSEESKKRWQIKAKARLEKLKWLDEDYLREKRKAVENDLMGMVYEIASANSIARPVCMAEADERRLHQDRAIMACEHLRLDLQDIIDTVPIEKNWMLQIAPVIEKEILLIKAWRKSDNTMRTALAEKENDSILKSMIDTANMISNNKVLHAIISALNIQPTEE